MGGQISVYVVLLCVLLSGGRGDHGASLVQTGACYIGDTGNIYVPNDTVSHIQRAVHLSENY